MQAHLTAQSDVIMGQSGSKNPKINKDHNKKKMLKIGISVGGNDLNLEGHFQVEYHGKTVKITNRLKNLLKTMCRSLLPSLKNKNAPYYHSFHSMSGHGRVPVQRLL